MTFMLILGGTTDTICLKCLYHSYQLRVKIYLHAQHGHLSIESIHSIFKAAINNDQRTVIPTFDD